MTTFEMINLRLKNALRTDKDQKCAEFLGLSKNAFSERKRRNAFPEKELRSLAQRRPELGINVDYVLAGAFAEVFVPHPSMSLQEVAHALNRVAPAMESGFVIQTSYGDLAIAPGPLAEHIRDLVAQHAQRELTSLAAQEGANHG
jgi:hypothetical protein